MALYNDDDSVAQLADALRLQLGVRHTSEAIQIALQNELARSKARVEAHDTARAGTGEPLRARLARLRERGENELLLAPGLVDQKQFMDDGWE